MDMVAVNARVTGQVQGVAFRAWARAEAQRLGLSGWVRNEPDGSVSALLMGSQTDVDAMVKKLNQGSTAARVAYVSTESVEPDPVIAGFVIAR